MPRAPRLVLLAFLAACSVKPVALTTGETGDAALADAAPAEAPSAVTDPTPVFPDAGEADAASPPDVPADTVAPAPDLAPEPAPDLAADRRVPPDVVPDPIEPDPDAAPPAPDTAPDLALDQAAPPPDTAPPAPDAAPDLSAAADAAPDLPAPDAGPAPHGRELVFVANQDSNDISVFSVDAVTGDHIVVAGSPFAAGERPYDLAITPDGKFLYVCHYGSEDIRGFRVADTGKLTPLPAPVSVPTPQVVVVAAGGKALYAYGSDGHLYGFTIDAATGALHAVTSPLIAGITSVQGLAADPRGRYLAVTVRTNSSGAGRLLILTFEAAGTLQLIAEVDVPGTFAADSPALAFDPTGSSLYGAISTSGGASNVFGFTLPWAGGTLTPIPGSPWPGVSEGFGFTFHPGRPLVYHPGTSEMRVFTRAADGSLSEVGGSPVVLFNNDTGASVSSLGTFLYVLYQTDNEVTVSRIAESGLPAPFAGSPWKVGTNPFAIVVWAPPLQ